MSALFKKVKAPPIPNATATAEAQAGYNMKEAIANANLNRIDQTNPYGSMTYTQTGTNPDGTPKYTQNVSYNPEQQARLGSQNAVADAMTANAQKMAGNVDTSAWDTSKFTPFKTGASSSGGIQFGYDPGGNIQDSYASGGNIKRYIDDAGNIQDSYASGGDIQKDLDYSGVSRLPGTDDFSKESQQVNDAVYKQATSRLDPQYEAEARKYAAGLAGKGISEDSQAYRKAMDDFSRRKTDAYDQATYSGIKAGAERQGQLFGMGLQARQQGVGEVNAQGAFHNAAQGQGEMQNANRAQFGNTAQAQRWGQNSEQAAFGNAAQSLSEEQNAARAQFGNNAQGQRNMQNANAAGFNNAAQSQDFGQSATNVGINNMVRNQQVDEYSQGRQEGIDRVAQSMAAGGGPVQPLNFNDYAATNYAGTPFAEQTNLNYQRAMEKYQADKAAKAAAWGSVAGLAGTATSAFMGKPKVA